MFLSFSFFIFLFILLLLAFFHTDTHAIPHPSPTQAIEPAVNSLFNAFRALGETLNIAMTSRQPVPLAPFVMVRTDLKYLVVWFVFFPHVTVVVFVSLTTRQPVLLAPSVMVLNKITLFLRVWLR